MRYGTLDPATTLQLIDHLKSFSPSLEDYLDVASWAVARASQGDWLSTRVVDHTGTMVTVARAIEDMRLGDFLPTTDPWAPLEI